MQDWEKERRYEGRTRGGKKLVHIFGYRFEDLGRKFLTGCSGEGFAKRIGDT